jgi:nitrite reductase (NADH) small subunit
MPFVKVGTLSDVPPNSVREVAVGETFYALCNVEGEVHALSGTCLHRGGPLGQGAIHGTNVVCPWHAWEWDCRTGENDYNPAERVATYPVKIEGEDVLIDVP